MSNPMTLSEVMTLPEVVKKHLNGQSPWQWLIDEIEEGCIPENNDVIENATWVEGGSQHE